MLDENNLFQRAASSAYASMAAFTAAANMYNSFYPTINTDPVNYFACTDMKRERLDPKIRVTLEDMDLWNHFYSLGNEMIITKNGRRLFPNFRVTVNELDPNVKYMFLLDIVPMDDNRYKYHESTWNISGKAEPHIYGRYYVHPDSPQLGSQWMKQSVLFNKVKITNSPMQNANHIILSSMHRYIPRLHIVQASDNYSIRTGPLSTFIFDETMFIAVTAYQNDQITKLKINNNPFAKGFREATHGKKNYSKSLKRLQTNFSPPTIYGAIPDSTTSVYLDPEQDRLSPTHHYYPSSMIYNPTAYTSSPSIHFPHYGRSVYQPHNYNSPFF